MIEQLWRLYRWALDLLFPPRCEVCRRVGVWLCEACARQLPLLDGPLCVRCGRPWSGRGLCSACSHAPGVVCSLRSAFRFEGPLRGAIHALKYRGGISVATVLGEPMARAWRLQAMESELLIPVPLYPAREVRRGYNQARLLAEALGRQVQLPVAPVAALRRVRNTMTQTRLGREDRRVNVEGAFAPGPELVVARKRVTLVDDVATTGATLDACATVLLAHGALRIDAFTLARAS